MLSLRILGPGLLLAATAFANGITDPSMGVDSGTFSDPISVGVNFLPQNGGGVFDFFNGTGGIIDKLVFQTNIAMNLDPSVVSANFNCGSKAGDAFFLGCSVGYVPETGILTITFEGALPSDNDETQEAEVGEMEGIPPIVPNCDSPAICAIGHFVITLNDNFATSGASGGWGTDSTLFPNGPQKIQLIELDVTPEPAEIVPLLLCILGFFAVRARRVHGWWTN